MVDHLTACIGSARSRTRVGALLIQTCSILAALRTHNAFRSARRWRSDVTRLTRAHRMTVHLSALTVWTARRRRTSLLSWSFCDSLLNAASSGWISSVAFQTETDRTVVLHTAFRIQSANSRARILAFVVDAGTELVAIRVLHTFRSATGVRIAKIFRQARARSRSVAFLTDCIRSTWGRIARVDRLRSAR